MEKSQNEPKLCNRVLITAVPAAGHDCPSFILCVANVIMPNHGTSHYWLSDIQLSGILYASRGSEGVKSYSQLATLAAEEEEEEEEEVR